LLWASVRSTPARGPVEYDVGLPDSATMTTEEGAGFDVAPSGDFVVYQTRDGNAADLWFRSLRDGTARRIDGTTRGFHPAISPDGSKVAFLRYGAGHEWTLETIAVQGGSSALIGRGSGDADLSWRRDSRLQVITDGGNEARWFDATGGPVTSKAIAFCVLPSPVPDDKHLLCGGSGAMSAHLVGVGEGPSAYETLWTGTKDSTQVFGSQFRLVDGKYLVYLSMDGDLRCVRQPPNPGICSRSRNHTNAGVPEALDRRVGQRLRFMTVKSDQREAQCFAAPGAGGAGRADGGGPP